MIITEEHIGKKLTRRTWYPGCYFVPDFLINDIEVKGRVYRDGSSFVATYSTHDWELFSESNKPEPKQTADRYNSGKIRFDLIPTEGLIELARAYTMGSYKYTDENWRKGLPYTNVIASLERHWNLWKSGVSVDKDTGCHHLALVCWNAMTLLVYCLTKTGTDDRRKYNIDSNFNLIDNHLGIGLSPDELEQFKAKYKQSKELSK